MERQTFRGPLQWIVVDDGEKPTRTPFLRESQSETVLTIVRPKPFWKTGQNTLARNILEALPNVLFEKIIFVEDDDWYSCEYLKTMSEGLDTASMVGETPSRYYHVPSKKFRIMEQDRRASLCQTGIRGGILPELERICVESSNYIDVRLWEVPVGLQTKRLISTHHVVGMKGLPGREGIGIGHNPNGPWTVDPALRILREWIREDVEFYQEYMYEPGTTTV